MTSCYSLNVKSYHRKSVFCQLNPLKVVCFLLRWKDFLHENNEQVKTRSKHLSVHDMKTLWNRKVESYSHVTKVENAKARKVTINVINNL